ncbi:MAG TPA: transcriptional activator NhaR [Thermoanaerobaculia bacterium]|nr:transcriptional activator NhaR [Thermoanaerobaculia bacterium]
MVWFNYNHLYYFWTVAREGSIARATEKLNLTQPTISEQLKTLEETLGEKLFDRRGRKLVLTDVGKMVYRYAEEIFSLGRELTDAIEDRPTGRPLRFSVGVSDVVPKAIAHRFLLPVLQMKPEVYLICIEDQPSRLLAELAVHELDLVISDAPSSGTTIRLFNHVLAESEVTLYASSAIARGLKRGFPQSLDGAPFLLPQRGTELRRRLEQWFDRHGVRPRIVGEFQDSALLDEFAHSGAGVFASISLLEHDLRDERVVPVGSVDGIRESYYAISRERKIKHPAIAAVLAAAEE